MMARALTLFLSMVMMAQIAFAHLPSVRQLDLRHPVIPASDSISKNHSDQKSPRLVTLIQDIHLNHEAQKQISQTVLELIALQPKNESLTVGVEGTVGDFDFSRFHSSSDRQNIREVADRFLLENRVGAASYVGLVNPEVAHVHMIGLEDRDLYLQNVDAYRKAQASVEKEKKNLTEQQKQLDDLSRLRLTPVQRNFTSLRQQLSQGKLSYGSYLQTLRNSFSRVDAPLSVESFLAAYELEKNLDFAAVERERNAVLQRFSEKAGKAELQELMFWSQQYKNGHADIAGYYARVKKLLERAGIDPRSFPHFENYLRYVLLSGAINTQQLFSDMAPYETDIVRSLNPTPEQKSLIDDYRRCDLTAKLLDFALSPEEWEEYQSSSPKVSIGDPLDSRQRHSGMTDVGTFEEFYRLAEARNEVLVENFLADFQTRGVMITGGFHTAAIQELLKARGIATSVVTPRISKLDNGSGAAYLSIFLQEKSPLEKLFTGRKLFLAVGESIGANLALQPALPPVREQAPELFDQLTQENNQGMWQRLRRWTSGFGNDWGSGVGPLFLGGIFLAMFSPHDNSGEPAGKPNELSPLFEDYRTATIGLFEAIRDLKPGQVESEKKNIINAARALKAAIPSGPNDPLAWLQKEVRRFGTSRVMEVDGEEIDLPLMNAWEILHMAAEPGPFQDEESLGAIKEAFEFFVAAFSEEKREKARAFVNDIDVVRISGTDLIPWEQLQRDLEKARRSADPYERDEIRQEAMDRLDFMMMLLGQNSPDHMNRPGARSRLSLTPRPGKPGILAMVALHELGHGVQAYKLLDLPRSSEVFTEAITMIAYAWKKPGMVMDSISHFGAERYFEKAAEWVKENPEDEQSAGKEGFVRLSREMQNIVRSEYQHFGVGKYFKSQAEALQALEQPEFTERQSGLFLGAVLMERYQGPQVALQKLVEYTNSVLAEMEEHHVEPVSPKSEDQINSFRRRLETAAQAQAGEPVRIVDWERKSLADFPHWRSDALEPEAPGVIQLEIPSDRLTHPDEDRVTLEAEIQGRIIQEQKKIIAAGSDKENSIFQLLLGTVLTARAESKLFDETRRGDF